jgi:putative chitinase
MADITGKVTPALVKKMFPDTKLAPITKNLPFVLDGLRAFDLGDRSMVLMALGTIRAETEGFVPISEFKSKFNTKTKPFDRYEPGTPKGKELGNTQPGDGARFKGRGFVQLTGRDNYTRVGKQLDIDLVGSPDTANDPATAGKILGRFLKNAEKKIRAALKADDLRTARKLVNGGSHGLAQFKDAFGRGQNVIPDA